MSKRLKRSLAIVLSVLMLLGSLPMSVFAEDAGATLTISANATGKDVTVDDDVSFDYRIIINGFLWNGTAKGSDGNDYVVKDGILTLPHKVKAVISGLEDGTSYSVQRLAYDNLKYALVGDGATISGDIATRDYYRTVNGVDEKISAETYLTETNNGVDTSRSFYVDAAGKEYSEAQTGTFVGYVENSGILGSVSYAAESAEYTYAASTKEDYSLKITGIRSDDIITSGSWVKTYKAGAVYATLQSDYPGYESKDIGVAAASTPALNKNGARTQMSENLVDSEMGSVYELLNTIMANTGKTAVVDQALQTENFSENSTFPDLATQIHAFTTVTPQEVSYRVEQVDADKTATFDVTLEKAPTGTLGINFILDGTVPEAFNGAVFELHRNGALLTEGTDYQLSVSDKSVKILTTELGFTNYTFSDLLSGSYTIRQVTGANGYAVDSTLYSFEVARADGAITGENIKDPGLLNGSKASLSNASKSILISTLNVFSNKSFSFQFNTNDQNGDPVEGVQFLMVERDGVIDLIKTFVQYGVGTATGMDWSKLLESLTSGDGFNFDVETIVKLIATLAELSPEQLENVTLPAILMAKSNADGVVEFENSSNILNALGLLAGLGDVKPSDLVSVLKPILSGMGVGDNILQYLDVLNAIDTTLSVHSGVPTGLYIFTETGGPDGYERNSTMYTVTVNPDGTAVVTSGVLVPLIADFINDRLNFDLYDILVSEEEFNNMSNQVKNLFGTFDGYMNTVVDDVLQFVENNLGGVVDLSGLDNLRNSIHGYYEQYDDFSLAVSKALDDFNSNIRDDFTDEWAFTVQRYYVEIALTLADCGANAIEGASLKVVDADSNEIALEEDGNVTVPYGTYTVTATVPEDYVLLDDKDTEGNALYTNPAVVEVNDHNAQYAASFYYHNEGEWTVVNDPTCTTAGYDTRSCTLCGKVLEERQPEATGHSYGEGVVTEPTCLTGGFTTYTCEVCGHSYTADFKDALGHDFEAVVTPPTVEGQGYTTYTCKRDGCDYSYVDNYEVPLGHQFATERDEERSTAPTCAEEGIDVFVCQTCLAEGKDHVLEVKVPPTGKHTVKALDAVAPTCTATGKTAGSVCSVCGAVLVEQKDVDKLPHDYTITVTPPTCEGAGYTTYDCKNCTESHTDDQKPALGHAWSVVINAATCEKAEEHVKTCIRCGKVEKETVGDSLGHDEQYKVIKPTCTSDGYTIVTCSRCDYRTTKDTVSALGHDIVIDPYVAPTCTESGWEEGSHCARCKMIQNGVGEYQREIPPLGHNAVGDAHKDPTCTESGLTAGSHCDRCGQILVAQGTIPALGHETGDWEIVTVPTTKNPGLMKKQCSRCGEVFEKKLPQIPVAPVIDDGITCVFCDEVQKYKDEPFLGPIIRFIHMFIHIAARFTSRLRVETL